MYEICLKPNDIPLFYDEQHDKYIDWGGTVVKEIIFFKKFLHLRHECYKYSCVILFEGVIEEHILTYFKPIIIQRPLSNDCTLTITLDEKIEYNIENDNTTK